MLKFADDVKPIGRVGSEDDVGRLGMDLINFGRWAEKWQMKFNDEKCKLMNIRIRNRKEDYELNGYLWELSKKRRIWVYSCLKISKWVKSASKPHLRETK